MRKRPIVPVKRFAEGDRLHVQAQRIWIILVAFVMHSNRSSKRPSTITYGEVAQAKRRDPRAGYTIGRQLGIIGRFCVENDLPPLNCIVVNQDTGLPGAEVVLRPGRSIAQEQAAVMKQDWFEIRVPTTGAFRRVLEVLSREWAA